MTSDRRYPGAKGDHKEYQIAVAWLLRGNAAENRKGRPQNSPFAFDQTNFVAGGQVGEGLCLAVGPAYDECIHLRRWTQPEGYYFFRL